MRLQRNRPPVPQIAVGEVAVYSWGYDQTNVDFFEVVAVSGKRLTLRAIAGEIVETLSSMSERVRPVPGAYLPDQAPLTKLAQTYDGTEWYVRMKCGIAEPCAPDSIHFASSWA